MRYWRRGAVVLVFVIAGGWGLLAQDQREFRDASGARVYEGPSLQAAERQRTLESIQSNLKQLLEERQAQREERQTLREAIEAIRDQHSRLKADLEELEELEETVKDLRQRAAASPEESRANSEAKTSEDNQASRTSPPSGARVIGRYEGHTSGVQSVAISPNGRWAASTANDGTLRIWDLQSHQADEVFFLSKSQGMGAVAFSPDGRFLVVTGSMGVQLREVGDWTVRWSERGATFLARDVAFSRDGEIVALPHSGHLQLREVATGKLIEELPVAPEFLYDVIFGPTGDELLITGSYYANGTTPITYYARLWNWKTGVERFRVEQPVSDAVWDIERERIYFIASGDSIEEWDAKTGKRARVWEAAAGDNQELGLVEEGRLLVVGLRHGVELWETKAARRVGHVALPDLHLRRLAVGARGAHVLTGGPPEETVWELRFPALDVARTKPATVTPRTESDQEMKPIDTLETSSSTSQTPHQQPKIELPRGGIIPFEIEEFARHEYPVENVVLSPNGHWIATTARGGHVHAWDAWAQERLAKIPVAPLPGHFDIAFSPDGKMLAIASTQGIKLVSTDDWRTGWGNRLPTPIQGNDVRVAFSPDGKWLAVAGNFSFQIWNVETHEPKRRVKYDLLGVREVIFNEDGEELLILADSSRPREGGGRRDLRIWNWKEDRQRILHGSGAHASAQDVAWNLERNRIYLLAKGRIAEWNSKSGLKLREWPIERGVTRIALSGDGRWLAAGTVWGTVDLWEPKTMRRVESLPAGVSRSDTLALSSDGGHFYVAERKSYQLQTGAFRTARGPDVKEIVSRYDSDYLREAAERHKIFNIAPIRRVAGPASPIQSFALAPDGKTAFVSTLRHGLDHWDLHTGTSLLDSHQSQRQWRNRDLHCLPDGESLLFLNMKGGGGGRQLVLWDVESWRATKKMGGIGRRLSCVALAPNGRIAATWGNQQITLWDISTGEKIRTLPIGQLVFDLAFSVDSRLLAANTMRSVRVWNVKTGVQIAEERKSPGISSSERTLAFSTEKPPRLLVSRDALVWTQIGNWNKRGYIEKPSGTFHGGTFSPDGELILAVCGDRTYLWDADTQRKLLSVPSGRAKTAGRVARFTHGGRQFLTLDQDGDFVFWPVPQYGDADDEGASVTPVAAPRPSSGDDSLGR